MLVLSFSLVDVASLRVDSHIHTTLDHAMPYSVETRRVKEIPNLP